MFLSTHADDERLFVAIRVGAATFLTKGTDPARIIETIHAVLDCLVMGRSNKQIGDAVTKRWAEIGPQPYAAVERAKSDRQ